VQFLRFVLSRFKKFFVSLVYFVVTEGTQSDTGSAVSGERRVLSLLSSRLAF